MTAPAQTVRTAADICDRCDAVPCRCAKSPTLRARRDGDSREAITHEAIPNAVLACGRCDGAIEGFYGMEIAKWVGALHAMPCGCEVRDAPIWARQAKPKEARRG